MKTLSTSISRLSRTGPAVWCLSIFTLWGACSVLAAPSIPNPSFEANSIFANSPGTVSANAAIIGWTTSTPTRVGLNPAGGLNVHADNGAVPNGTRVAFLQSDTNNPATLSTTVGGLVPGTHYRLEFRFNRKSVTSASNVPAPTVRLGAGVAHPFLIQFSVDSAGLNISPYNKFTLFFVATAATAPLEITNTTSEDSSLLVDHFTVAAAAPLQVTNINNDGPGSLRQAMASAAATPAFNVITFAPALSGQTIKLLSRIDILDLSGVAVDATALPKGLTLDGELMTDNLIRIGGGMHFRGLTFINGKNDGGAIKISSSIGTLHATRCTFASNGNGFTAEGGAIKNLGATVLTQCTFTENASTDRGGALHNSVDARMVVDQCTICFNDADVRGGGIYNNGLLTLANSIVAGNDSPSANDIANDGVFGGSGARLIRVGANLVQSSLNINGGSSSGPAVLNAPPNLDGLSDNGGPTRTIALLNTSVARNASVGSIFTTDQRNRPVQGPAHDLGAYDTQRGSFLLTGTRFVQESAGPAGIAITRTDGFEGVASVKLSTIPGTAGAADIGLITNQTFNFADGVEFTTLTVPITNDVLVEANESYTVALSAPTGGASLSTRASLVVTIVDPSSLPTTPVPETVPPGTPVFTSPAANASVNCDGTLTVTGTASDNKGLSAVQARISLDGSAPTAFSAINSSRPRATSTSWSHTFSIGGAFTTAKVEVMAQDLAGNTSPIVSRTVKLLHPLRVPIAGNGSVTSGFAPVSFREVGSIHTITATPAAGVLFAGWTVGGGPTLSDIGIASVALQRPTLTFLHRLGLVLTPNFVPSPFTPDVTGNYKGLILPSNSVPAGGTPSNNSTEGLFNLTLASTGAFTGTLQIDGQTLSFSGAMDHTKVARFGTSRATILRLPRPGKSSLLLQFELEPVSGGLGMDGTLTAVDFRNEIVAQSVFQATRAAFNGTTALASSSLLGPGHANQVYNIVLEPVDVGFQPAGFEEDDYPQGTGFGRVTVTKAGTVTLTDGALADGTAGATASTFLDNQNSAILFIPLYNKAGFLRTRLFFAPGLVGTDVAGHSPDPKWLRPEVPTSHYYPAGWPEGIAVGLRGSKYIVTAGQSVFVPANGTPLDAPDQDGNVRLQFQKGQLAETLFKFMNLSTADAVTKLPVNNPTFTFSLSRATGLFTGTFAHTDTTLVSFKGILVQEPPNSGGFGFFLTKQPVPIDFSGESGKVILDGLP